jgi:hypothetical protein
LTDVNVMAETMTAAPPRTSLQDADDLSAVRLVNTALSPPGRDRPISALPGPFLDATAGFGGDFRRRAPAPRLDEQAIKAGASGN